MNYDRASSGAALFARSNRLCIISYILCLTTLSIYARPQYEGVDRNVIIVPPVYPPSIKPMNEQAGPPTSEPAIIALKRSIIIGNNESTAIPPTTPDNDIKDVTEPSAIDANISHSIDAVVDQIISHGERVETVTPDEGLQSSISPENTSEIPLPSDFTEFLTKHHDMTKIDPNQLDSNEEQQSTSDYGTEMTADDSQSTMNTVSKTTKSSLLIKARDQESSGKNVAKVLTIAPLVEIASAIDGETPSSSIDESSITIDSPHDEESDEESDEDDSNQTTLSGEAAAFSLVTTVADEPLPVSTNETIVVISSAKNTSTIDIVDESNDIDTEEPTDENSSAQAAIQLDEKNLIIEAALDERPTTNEKTMPIAAPVPPPSSKSGDVVSTEKKASRAAAAAAADHAGLIGPAGSYGEVASVKAPSPPSPRPNEVTTTTMMITSDKGGIEEADVAKNATTTVSVAEQSEETIVTQPSSTVTVESTSAITTESIIANETSGAPSDQTTSSAPSDQTTTGTTMLTTDQKETTTTASSDIPNQTEEADAAEVTSTTTAADVGGANETKTTDIEESSGMSEEMTTTEITTTIELASGDGATTAETDVPIEITTLKSNESMTTTREEIKEEADAKGESTMTTTSISNGTVGVEADEPNKMTTTQVSIGVESMMTTEESYGSSIGVESESTTISSSIGGDKTTESSVTTIQIISSSTSMESEATTMISKENATTETIVETPESTNVTKGPLVTEENPYEAADLESGGLTTKAVGPPGIDPNRVIVVGAVEPQTTTTTIAPSTEIVTTTVAAMTGQSISGEMIELTTASTIASETLASESTEISTSSSVTMSTESTVQVTNITAESISEVMTTTLASIENVTKPMEESSTSGWRTVTANISEVASTTAIVGEEQSYGSSDIEQTTTVVTTELSMADAAIGSTTAPVLIAEEQNATTTSGVTQSTETMNVTESMSTVGSEMNVTITSGVTQSTETVNVTESISTVGSEMTVTTVKIEEADLAENATTTIASSTPTDIQSTTSGASSAIPDIITTTIGAVKLSTTTVVEVIPEIEENPYGGGGEPIAVSESVITTTIAPIGSSESVITTTIAPIGSSESVITTTIAPIGSSESVITTTIAPIESSTSAVTTTTVVVQSTTSPIIVEEPDAATESSGIDIESETTLTTEMTLQSSSIDTQTTDVQDNTTVSNGGGGRPIATVVPSGYGKNETEEGDVEGSGQAPLTTQMPGASDHTIELESTTVEESPSVIEPSGYGDSGPAIKLPVHSSKLLVIDDEARAVHTRVIEDEARVHSREVPPATLQSHDDVENDSGSKSHEVENSLKLAVGRLVVRRNLTFASPITPRPGKLFHAVTRPSVKAHGSLLHSDLLMRQKWQPYHMNCTEEIDERGEYCRDWALGGLCDTHRPTMFLFCRRTCLCTGPPSPDDEVRRRRWRS